MLGEQEPPLGEKVDWKPARLPEHRALQGEHMLLRPTSGADGEALFEISHPPSGDPSIWTYLPYGPFEGPDELRHMLEECSKSRDPLFFTISSLAGRPLGVASYLRITPEHGTIEIGHIWFGPQLKRSTAATEAIYLLARQAFDELGYRRLEWKCDSLNAASRRAAERFGFTFEGVFRKHQIVKGRNRDTAWFSITDEEWAALRPGYEAWLAPENFDEQGRQRRALGELIKDPAGTPAAPS